MTLEVLVLDVCLASSRLQRGEQEVTLEVLVLDVCLASSRLHRGEQEVIHVFLSSLALALEAS